MKKILLLISLTGSLFAYSQTQKELEGRKVKLPNGWELSPAGKGFPLGDLPLNMAVSPSGKYIAVTNNGQSVQSIQLVDVNKEAVVCTAVIPKSWYGLKFSADGKNLYASGGNDNRILQYAVEDAKLVLKDSIELGPKWPYKLSPAGIDIDDKAGKLYVVTKENNRLYIVSLAAKKIIDSIPLAGEGYACLLSPDCRLLYISCWGCDRVIRFSTETKSIVSEILVGDNPNELLLNKKGDRLFVANANDNSVSVIDTRTNKVTETLNASLYPGSPAGSTSNGLALSSNEKTLYVANADNNCLAVFDVSRPGYSKSKGFIPTGWYPTNVKVLGKKIFVANGKGFTSMANPYGPNPLQRRQQVNHHAGDSTRPGEVQYIGGLFKGSMSVIPEPGITQMSIYTMAVLHNTPYRKQTENTAKGEPGNPVPMSTKGKSPIKHVFYIIKENRTYDQVLGDIAGGNGDTSLVLFGEHITPNLHKLAKEFVLLDNFYCDGEVSADGHEWSMGAYATDYLEKTWPTNYGGRGGNYDGEGMREVANNKAYIWNQCRQKNISYRTYGEFTDGKKASVAVLKDHFSPVYTGWDMDTRDTIRFRQWKTEFDSLLAINAVPQFNTLRFGNDHTEGLRKGKPSPYAHVADNDLAVGLFMDYLSHSPIWKESAVFIIEDDAQNGSDHVDAHRTTAYVAGGFVKSGYVDHTMYSTSSMLHTIELILGLQPMSQYDAAAEPMWRCFSATANHAPFTSLPNNISLDEKNVAVNEWQRRSELFDFAHEDAVPDMEFNVVLWYGLKGDHRPMPAPRRAAFLKVNGDMDDED